VAPDRAAAVAEAPYLEPKYEAYRQWEQDKALPAGESSRRISKPSRATFLLGDPARVREKIARYCERLGVTTMIVRVQWPGMEQAEVLRSIRLLGEHVFPHLR
jgi:alkanesulfonate monooxygenase SsuD/methylene tetrahydromethanopterin reductase-like flavin-dependent oxidoreductase (luciferase family)